MTERAIPTPPQTPPLTNPSAEVSLERLDALLETYLELLDQYTTLRTELSKRFSDGFFSLARANHTSPSLGSGRRYGEEGYDERMKAGRRIVYEPTASISTPVENGLDVEGAGKAETEAKEPVDLNQTSSNIEHEDAEEATTYRISIQTIPPPPPSPTTLLSDEPETVTNTSNKSQSEHQPPPSDPITLPPPNSKPKTNPKPIDPLHWYGILIPQPLRASQSSFVSAVCTSIPALLNTSTQMAKLEIQIRDLRLALGLQTTADILADERSELTRQAVQEEGDSNTGSKPVPERKSHHQAALSPINQRKRLVQQPTEPRPRILKLDN